MTIKNFIKEKTKNKPFIEGKSVILRAIELEDFKFVVKWLNDPEVTHYMFYGQYPTNKEQIKKMVREYIEAPQHIVFMCVDKKNKKPFGFAGVFDIDSTGRTGGLVALLGDKSFWNRGYGLEVIALLTHFSFDRLNLNMAYLGMTRADNRGAVRMYETIGYKFGGVRRQYLYRNSRYYDAAFMDMLRDEYYGGYSDMYLKKFFV